MIEHERLRPSILEAAARCMADRRALLEYGLERVPEEDELIRLCSACDASGRYRQYQPGVGTVEDRCRHASAVILMILEHTQ